MTCANNTRPTSRGYFGAGDVQGTFSPKPDPGFGIHNAAWHPTGMFLAVAGWDNKIYILDGLIWSAAAMLELLSKIPVGASALRPDERLQGPQTISSQCTDPTKLSPKSGAVQLEWNKTGTLLLLQFENCPTVVHLYDFPALSDPFVPWLRCIFQHSKPVLHAQWNPVHKGSLALCSGSGSIYTWSDGWIGDNGVEEDMAECIGVPANSSETLFWRTNKNVSLYHILLNLLLAVTLSITHIDFMPKIHVLL
ncbi:hypothetical protein F4604DRAFT_1689825 [Suillus subluteus]|nr:hypothetical protein F4604DRAFT_1689825 [Suillus subluteus]